MYFGRNNISATIHVPFDCGQSCEFCTVKKTYVKHEPNTYGVLSAVEFVNKLTIPEVVISGGEPFADLDFLDYLVTRLNKKIYINTCMPNNIPFHKMKGFLKAHKIRGINISRHDTVNGGDKMFKNIASDDYIKELAKIASVRINCVLNEFSVPHGVIDRWKNSDIDISFRADYTTITPETLHTLEGTPPILFKHPFISESHCDVCQTFRFVVDGSEVIYHKGLKHTRIGEQINDIIVYPDGQIALDWDAEPITSTEMTELLRVGKKIENPKTAPKTKASQTKPKAPPAPTKHNATTISGSCGGYAYQNNLGCCGTGGSSCGG